MKILLAILISMVSTSAMALELKAEDYTKIKSIVMKASSDQMLKDKEILEPLFDGAFDSIVISLNLLRSMDVVSVEADILPAEENCGCQDVFVARMRVHKKDGKWILTDGRVTVENLDLDQ